MNTHRQRAWTRRMARYAHYYARQKRNIRRAELFLIEQERRGRINSIGGMFRVADILRTLP